MSLGELLQFEGRISPVLGRWPAAWSEDKMCASCRRLVALSQSQGRPRNVPIAVDDCGTRPQPDLGHGDRSLGRDRCACSAFQGNRACRVVQNKLLSGRATWVSPKLLDSDVGGATVNRTTRALCLARRRRGVQGCSATASGYGRALVVSGSVSTLAVFPAT